MWVSQPVSLATTTRPAKKTWTITPIKNDQAAMEHATANPRRMRTSFFQCFDCRKGHRGCHESAVLFLVPSCIEQTDPQSPEQSQDSGIEDQAIPEETQEVAPPLSEDREENPQSALNGQDDNSDVDREMVNATEDPVTSIAETLDTSVS